MIIFVSHELVDRETALRIIDLARNGHHTVIDPIEPATHLTVEDADLFVGIVGSEPASVCFELGLFSASGKSVLAVARSNVRLPAGFERIRTVLLEDDSEAFEDTFSEALAELDAEYRLGPQAVAELNEQTMLKRVSEWFEQHGGRAAVSDGLGPDMGVDLTVSTDGEVIPIQVSAVRVSVGGVREMKRYMSQVGATNGLILTTGGGTGAAMALAAREGVTLIHPNELLNAQSLNDLAKPPAVVTHKASQQQVLGYWYGPTETIPPAPSGPPTGCILLQPNTSDLTAIDNLCCLDLVEVKEEWVVLSEHARFTYHHTSGMVRREQWRFVPIENATGTWPTVFMARLGQPLEAEKIEEKYGGEAFARARHDARALQLLLRVPRNGPAILPLTTYS